MSQQVADSEYEYDYDDEEDDYPVEDEEDSDDDDAMVHDNPNAAPSGGKVSGISMLTPEDLAPEVQRRIHDVQEILNIPPEASMVLLREFNFSKEALLERYYQDSDQVLQKCGVWARCQGKSVSSDSTTSSCPICYEDQLTASQLFAMPCGHTFCKPCWNDFVQTAVADGPSCIRTTCPEASCKEVVTDQEVQQVAPMEMVQKFQLYQLRAFVDSSALTRWCPGRGCDKIASAKNELALEHEGHGVHCTSCQAYFCLRCGQEPHRPCTCAFLQKWLEKCRNESETANWILANTKPCPRCSSRIEKNQGCNHMTCQRCKFEFCWICMGDWNEHGANTGGYYKCNRFDSGTGSEEDQSDAAKAKRELDRYLHYYKRYHAHAEAQAFAQKQLKETEQRMVLLQESSVSAKWSDVEFLKQANEQLIECRRVLKYTYTFAYYLTDDSKKAQKECFEYHQEMLERFTENLSELSEKALAEMDRTSVVNQTRVVDRFMKNILKYVEDGMEDVTME